jgi:hypothetical protein
VHPVLPFLADHRSSGPRSNMSLIYFVGSILWGLAPIPLSAYMLALMSESRKATAFIIGWSMASFWIYFGLVFFFRAKEPFMVGSQTQRDILRGRHLRSILAFLFGNVPSSGRFD